MFGNSANIVVSQIETSTVRPTIQLELDYHMGDNFSHWKNISSEKSVGKSHCHQEGNHLGIPSLGVDSTWRDKEKMKTMMRSDMMRKMGKYKTELKSLLCFLF